MAGLVVGCGDGKGSSSVSDGGAYLGSGASADFYNKFVSAYCQYNVNCNEAASVAACRADYFDSGALSLASTLRQIDSGRVIYDASKAATCFGALATAGCSRSGSSSLTTVLSSGTCATLLRGTVSVGGACVSSDECSNGTCLKVSCGASCCLGTCTALSAAGASCTSTSGCVDGAYCSLGTSSPGTCMTRVGQGQSCSTDSSACQPGLTCDYSGTKTCLAYVNDGQPCTASGPSCDNVGSYCNSTGGTCQPRLKVGAACTPISATSSGCVSYAECLNGTCTSKPAPGEACTVPDGGYALYGCSGGSCTQGTCVVTPSPVCTIESALAQDAGARD